MRSVSIPHIRSICRGVWLTSFSQGTWVGRALTNIGLAIESIASYQGDYNIFHNDNPDRAIVVWTHEPEFSLNSIAAGDWTAFSGQDIHSLVCSTPETKLFRDLGNWDFHLREGSIAIDAGTPQNVPSIDYDGVSRPQGKGYDIGAYERDARPATAK